MQFISNFIIDNLCRFCKCGLDSQCEQAFINSVAYAYDGIKKSNMIDIVCIEAIVY